MKKCWVETIYCTVSIVIYLVKIESILMKLFVGSRFDSFLLRSESRSSSWANCKCTGVVWSRYFNQEEGVQWQRVLRVGMRKTVGANKWMKAAAQYTHVVSMQCRSLWIQSSWLSHLSSLANCKCTGMVWPRYFNQEEEVQWQRVLRVGMRKTLGAYKWMKAAVQYTHVVSMQCRSLWIQSSWLRGGWVFATYTQSCVRDLQ